MNYVQYLVSLLGKAFLIVAVTSMFGLSEAPVTAFLILAFACVVADVYIDMIKERVEK